MGLFYDVKGGYNGNYDCHICNRIFHGKMAWDGHKGRNDYHKKQIQLLMPIYYQIQLLKKITKKTKDPIKAYMKKMGLLKIKTVDFCIFCKVKLTCEGLCCLDCEKAFESTITTNLTEDQIEKTLDQAYKKFDFLLTNKLYQYTKSEKEIIYKAEKPGLYAYL
jgi:hypothetical protein